MRIISCFVAFVMLLFSWTPGWASVVGTFNTSSLGITEISGPVIPGTVYSFDFELASLASYSATPFVTGSSSFGYLNVMSGSDWLIQNEPIPLIDALLTESQHFWFTSAAYPTGSTAAILNDIPFAAVPTPDAAWSIVGGASSMLNYGAADPHGEVGAAPAPGTPPPAVAVIEGYLRGGVPDIKQLDNECGPTSTLNSLLWLIKKYNLNTGELPKKPDGSLDQQAILKQLADAMQKHNSGGAGGLANDWNPNTPVLNNDRGYPGLERGSLEAGKVDFIATNKLGLVVEGGVNDVKAQGAAAFSFVQKEIKKGQDVEFLIKWPGDNGYHWVTVTGYIDAGKDKKTLIVHDPLKGDGNNYWKLKDDGTFTTPNGTANRAVAESTPEPSTLVLFGCGAALLAVRRWRRKPTMREMVAA